MSLTKQDAATFLEARIFCVIATVNDQGRPEAAFVAYSSNNDLEMIIGTSNSSRKYANILQNSAVALVIADTAGEIQYEGKAEVITSQDYESLMAKGRFKKLSGFDKYRDDPTQVYLRIQPTWLRLIVHGEADQIAEFTEFA
jgi:nitroimidazol reductase NimA-like FMN-containing flavoprotein (pyridoxamine 5'-phosphate oxidase superfamily)